MHAGNRVNNVFKSIYSTRSPRFQNHMPLDINTS